MSDTNSNNKNKQNFDPEDGKAIVLFADIEEVRALEILLPGDPEGKKVVIKVRKRVNEASPPPQVVDAGSTYLAWGRYVEIIGTATGGTAFVYYSEETPPSEAGVKKLSGTE